MTGSAATPAANAGRSPGFVNAHTHIYSALAAFGLSDPDPKPRNFPEILERIWWRLDRVLDRPILEASARWYAARSLLLGTTGLIDHHESPEFIEGSLDVLADACEEIGIRAVLCFGATERNGGLPEARRGLEECRRFIRTNSRPLVRGLVGLHASFTVSDETIGEAGGLCRELDVAVHVHVAEDLCDVEDARRRGYEGPYERLKALGGLPPGSIMAHGVHLDGREVADAGDKGVWLVQNPRSNRGNRVGYPRHLARSPLVALGTDGYPSDAAAECEALAEGARAQGESLEVVPLRRDRGRTLLGSLFDPNSGQADLAGDEVVFENGRPAAVTVNGRTVVRDGRLVTADLEEIEARAREQWKRLRERMDALP